jgi:hypothetical protein
MGLVGVLIGLFATAGSLVVAGIAMIICVALAPFFPDYIGLVGLNPAVIIFASIRITCLGLLFAIGMSYLTKYFYIGIAKYLKWNIEFVKGWRGLNAIQNKHKEDCINTDRNHDSLFFDCRNHFGYSGNWEWIFIYRQRIVQ